MAFISILRILFIGLCALGLLVQTRLLLHLPLTTPYLDGFVGLGTVFGYYWTHPTRMIRAVAWLCGLAGGIFVLMWVYRGGDIWLVVIPAVSWLAYYGFQRPGQTGLRANAIAKPITVAFTWAWTTVVLPALATPFTGMVEMAVERAAFIFALALAYDLSDLAYDHKHGLETLVQRFNPKQVFRMIAVFLAVSGVLVIVEYRQGVYSTLATFSLLFSLVLSYACIRWMFAVPKLKPRLKVMIDGLILLQTLLVLLLH